MKEQDDTVRVKSVHEGTEKHRCHATEHRGGNAQWACPSKAKAFWIDKSEFVTENSCVRKELVSDLLHSGLRLSVSQCYLPCITTRLEGAQSNAGGSRSSPLTDF